jgi:two-component system, LytTR family, sensor kinase
LAQAYGEQHRFDTLHPSEGGFAVVIEIPFERRNDPPAVAVPAQAPIQASQTQANIAG